MKKNRKILLLMSTVAVAGCICAVIPFATDGGSLFAVTEQCKHNGNHYLAKDPTCSESGNVEFWACCECHTQFTAQPTDGAWIDCGVYSGTALDSSHVAYVAPTGEHHYKNTTYVDDTTVYLVYACEDCGDGMDHVISTMDRKLNATFEVVQEQESRRGWNYNENTGVYTSSNKGISSSQSFMVVKILTPGTITFDYTSSGEGGYDYMYFGPSDNEAAAYVNCKGSGTQRHDVADTYSREVVVDEKIHFVFKKDSGSNVGDDCGTVKFVEGDYVYNALTLESNGGTSLTPMFIENGKVAGTIPEPTKTGNYFEGWFVDNELTEPVTDETVFSGDSTIYAKWSEPLTVTLHANGGTCVDSVQFKVGTEPEIPEPVRDDYHFAGWYLESTFVTPYVSEAQFESFDLYAKWIAESDTHELYGSYGGFKFKPNSTSAPSDSYAELTVDFSGNYTLRTAFSSYENGTLGSVTSGTVVSSNNGVVYTFDDNNIIVIHEKSTFATSDYLYVLFKGSAPTKSGTTSSSVRSLNKASFVQFTYDSRSVIMMVDNSDGSITFDVSIVDSNDVDVTYTNIGKSSFDGMYFLVKDSGGQVIREYGYDTSFTVVTDQFSGIKGTYTSEDGNKIVFSGNGKAYTSFNGTSVATVINTAYEDTYIVGTGTTYKTIYVDTVDKVFEYEVAEASLTFNANGGIFSDGSEVKHATVVYGEWYDPTKKVDEPTREGYTFNGWWREGSTKGETWVKTLSPQETFTAHWLKNITVSFLEIDDTPVAGCPPVTVAEGKTLSSLPTPVKAGNFFMGWFLDKEFNVEFTTKTVVGDSDLPVYAKWEEALTLTIYYGEDEPLQIGCLPGVKPDIEDLIAKPGFGIEGYFAENTFETPVDLSNGILEDTVVYVKYVDLTAFVSKYVGYNAYNNTKGKEQSPNSSYQGEINSSLAGSGRVHGTIIGASNGVITSNNSGTKECAAYAVADDGTVFLCNHYQGFRSTLDMSGKDLWFAVSCGTESYDASVRFKHEDAENNHIKFTVTKGGKTYIVDADCKANTLTVVSIS